MNFSGSDSLDATADAFGRDAALDHFRVLELIGGRVSLIEAANGLHGNMTFARFLGERLTPPVEILDPRMQLFAGGAGEPDGGMDMNMPPVRVHDEHIFMSFELARERRPRGVHEGLLVGPRLRAQDHMREIPRAARSHGGTPGLGDLERRVELCRS